MAKLVISETCNCSHTHTRLDPDTSDQNLDHSQPSTAGSLSSAAAFFLVAIRAVPDSYERGERDYS